MFDIGWGEILVLVIAGLFILGPERLPGAARWLGQTLRQIREYATGARDQLRNELGPEFEEFRKPLEDLGQLRNFNPRTAITQHLFGEDDEFNGEPNNFAPPASSLSAGAAGAAYQAPRPQRPLDSGERAPYDPDAT